MYQAGSSLRAARRNHVTWGIRHMTRSAHFQKSMLVGAIAVAAILPYAWRADADPYVQTDLVSDLSGLAHLTDSALVNPWGVSASPASPIWTSNQGTSTANLFSIT